MERYRREEQRLREAGEESRHQQRMPSAAQRSAAIRRGMDRAQAGTSRRKGWIYTGTGAAVLAAGALLIGYGELSHELPQTQQPTETVQAEDLLKLDASLEPFYKLVSNDATLSSALTRKAVQPIQLQSERDGFTLTVRGMARDSRSLTLFYTLQAPNGDRLALNTPTLTEASRDQKVVVSDYALRHEEFDVIEEIQYGVVTLPLLPQYGESEQFTLKAQVVSGRQGASKTPLQIFELPIHSPSTTAQEEKLVFKQPKTMKVGGRNFAIDQMLVTPLRIYMSVNQKEGMNLSQLISPRLIVNHDGQEKTLAKDGQWAHPDYQETGRYDWVYANGSGQGHLDSIVLHTEGVSKLPEPGSTLVLDTDQSKVLKAPGQGYSVSLKLDAYKKPSLVIRYPSSNKDWSEGRMLFVGMNFTDGKGVVHQLQTDQNGSLGGGSSNPDGTASVDFHLEKMDYPQPLTFQVTQIPGRIEDPQEMRLK
ncbi:hypothetical protein B9G55_11290 [Saccharibacillus sp. O16]|nr:hypothetical protein B9G55_11290 [Saccharibacillus sp. O16]